MLGLSSFVYRWAIGRSYYKPIVPMTPLQFVESAITHQVDAVMFCHNFPFETYTSNEIDNLALVCKQKGLVVEMGSRGSDPAYFLKMLEVTDRMGAAILRMTLNIDRSEPTRIPIEMANARACLEQLLPVAHAFGIRLAIENYVDLPSTEMASLVEYFHDPYLGVCYDSANSVLGLENPVETAQLLAPYTITAHFKDVKSEMNPRGNVLRGVALGDGMVDFPAILKTFRKNGFNGCIHLELYIDRKEDPIETLVWEEACVVRSVDYARRVLGL